MNELISFENINENQLKRLGFCLGKSLRAGDVVLLRGEMGAGKSVLTRAAAQGMGVEGPVPSPTFTILNIHEGTELKLYHFDLYRLESADALFEMGLEEYIPSTDGATFIEWPQMAEEAMPGSVLEIEIVIAAGGTGAQIGPEGKGVGFMNNFTVCVTDGELIAVIARQMGDENLPNPVWTRSHGTGGGIPVVEVADDADACGIGGPCAEQTAGNAVFIPGGVGTKDAPGRRRPTGSESLQFRKKVVPGRNFPEKGHIITCLVGEEGSVGEMQQFRDGMSP